MASTVCVWKARAVEAISVIIRALSIVGLAVAVPPPQADRPSRAMAVKIQDIFVKRFMMTKPPFQQIWPK
jgi:hypothetical protein